VNFYKKMKKGGDVKSPASGDLNLSKGKKNKWWGNAEGRGYKQVLQNGRKGSNGTQQKGSEEGKPNMALTK